MDERAQLWLCIYLYYDTSRVFTTVQGVVGKSGERGSKNF